MITPLCTFQDIKEKVPQLNSNASLIKLDGEQQDAIIKEATLAMQQILSGKYDISAFTPIDNVPASIRNITATKGAIIGLRSYQASFGGKDQITQLSTLKKSFTWWTGVIGNNSLLGDDGKALKPTFNPFQNNFSPTPTPVKEVYEGSSRIGVQDIRRPPLQEQET